jgi:hypothetical protein
VSRTSSTRSRAVRVAFLGAALGAVTAELASAQSPEIRTYYLNVASGAAEGPLSEAGAADLQRLRFMSSPSLGPVTLDLAYEHILLLTSTAEAGRVSGVFGVSPAGGEWWGLQGTLVDGDNVSWEHRLDRLALSLAVGDSEVSFGRQPISWATTLLLTPADPFAPFDPEDPFREYRTGVDAARLRAFLGAFTDVDLVVRPSDIQGTTTVTALGRLRSAVGRWELAGWGGALHDQPAVGLGVTVTVGGVALRGEGVLRGEEREAGDHATIVRFTVGADRNVRLGERDLYLVAEYQRDGFGARSADGLPDVLLSRAFARGELQVLGRHTAALRGTYQLHPLWTTELLLLGNLGDPSVLLAPAASYSLEDNLELRFGLFLGVGAGTAPEDPDGSTLPGSEYGPIPAFAYASFTAFF